MPEQIVLGSKPTGVHPSRAWTKWELFALLIPVLGFGFLATYQIHRPGLYYDEMFVIAPAFGVNADKSWFGVPILVSSYVGADKAWIYGPIFALFGISAWSIRLPAVLISCATLGVGYLLLRNVLNRRWALVFSAACAVHPAFVFLTKVDWGPVVIMLFLKALCLLLCFRWLDGQTKSCWTVLILCGLGFWDKFNFIWFVIALILASCAAYGDVILLKLRRVRPTGLITLGVGLLTSGLITLWIIFPLLQKPPEAGFASRLLHIWALYQYTCTGLATAMMWFRSVPRLPTWTGWVLPILTLVFLMLAGAVRATRRSTRIDRRALRFCFWCFVMFGVIFFEIALTPQAGGAHHTIMLFPFDLLTCFSAAYLFASMLPEQSRWLVHGLQGCILGLWVASNGTSLAMHYNQFRDTRGFYGRFSPRIEALAKYLEKKGAAVDAIYCVEWGIGNQLRALCKPAIARKVKDYWSGFQDWTPHSVDAQSTVEKLFQPGERALYLSFTKSDPVFVSAQRHFAEMAAMSNKVTRPLPNFPGKLAETYQIFESDPR